MMFSKTFGYALRSILYIACQKESRRVQLNEIAAKLNIPRHFLGKVMIRLAKENVLSSLKGPAGGFSMSDDTLTTPLLKIADITGESSHLNSCVLRLNKCDSLHPCPLHFKALEIRSSWLSLLETTTIDHLLKGDQPAFIQSIVVVSGSGVR